MLLNILKSFYPYITDKKEKVEKSETIFDACKFLLTKIKDNLFPYNTDGLIFTPNRLGVGSDVEGEAGPLSKVTWEYSFKWKPPQYNTIDFLVTTLKSPNGEDVIKSVRNTGYILRTVRQRKPV